MQDLFIETQGVKGKNKKQYKVGRCLIFKNYNSFDNNYIEVDNFKGYGSSYEQREQLSITFRINDEFITFNSFDELEKVILDYHKSKKIWGE